MLLDVDLERCIKAKIHKALGWSKNSLPFSYPVPMRTHHLHRLNTHKRYVFAEKKAGIEALIYHGMEGLFWYGKDGHIHPLHLENLPVLENEQQMTIAQAIWITQEKTFYVEDVPLLKGHPMIYRSMTERLQFFGTEWLGQRLVSPKDRFKVTIRFYQDVEFLNKIKNPPKDIVFAEDAEFYRCGRNPGIWEWRNPQTTTVDLRLRWKKMDNVYSYSLWGLESIGETEGHFCDLPHLSSTDHPKLPNNTIVECHYDHEKKVFSRAEMAWVNGIWTPTNYKKEIQKPDRLKDVWHKVTCLKENITFPHLAQAFKEYNEKYESPEGWDEDSVEWMVVE